jgi:SAM dependent carboxyl methyltransferase
MVVLDPLDVVSEYWTLTPSFRKPRAVRNIVLDPGDQPVVIADYGSSQGKNSLAPMRIAIRNLRRLGPNRPIVFFQIDQPSNDFNSLFEVLSSDPDRYILDEANVFPCDREFLLQASASAGFDG